MVTTLSWILNTDSRSYVSVVSFLSLSPNDYFKTSTLLSNSYNYPSFPPFHAPIQRPSLYLYVSSIPSFLFRGLDAPSFLLS